MSQKHTSWTFVVLERAQILPDLLHTYLDLNNNGSPYKVLIMYAFCFYLIFLKTKYIKFQKLLSKQLLQFCFERKSNR